MLLETTLWFPVKDRPSGLPIATRVLACRSPQWAVQYVCVPTHICKHYLFSASALLESMIFTYCGKIFIANFTILSLHFCGIKYTHIVQTLQPSIARIFSSSPAPHRPTFRPSCYHSALSPDWIALGTSCMWNRVCPDWLISFMSFRPRCSGVRMSLLFQTEYFIIWIYHV